MPDGEGKPEFDDMSSWYKGATKDEPAEDGGETEEGGMKRGVISDGNVRKRLIF